MDHLKTIVLVAAMLGCSSLFSAPAVAEIKTVRIAVGPSANTTDGRSLVMDSRAPARSSGGEVFAFAFKYEDNKKEANLRVHRIRIVGMSASRKGRVVIREFEVATGRSTSKVGSLYQFTRIEPSSRAENYQGFAMLADGNYVEHVPRAPLKLSKLIATVESFQDEDSSFEIELEYEKPARPVGLAMARAVVANARPSPGADSGDHGRRSEDRRHPIRERYPNCPLLPHECNTMCILAPGLEMCK